MINELKNIRNYITLVATAVGILAGAYQYFDKQNQRQLDMSQMANIAEFYHKLCK